MHRLLSYKHSSTNNNKQLSTNGRFMTSLALSLPEGFNRDGDFQYDHNIAAEK
jgi:hypothetical protein